MVTIDSVCQSNDGLNWDRKGVVIDNGTANHVNDPSVVVVDGRYYMFYTRAVRDVIDRIDLAVSSDGKPGASPVSPTGGQCRDMGFPFSVGRPTVLYEGGLFPSLVRWPQRFLRERPG
ncbi:MAG: hypothetical protein R3C11_23445 [Planctomycetaceae bacterium]